MLYVFDLDETLCTLPRKINGGWDYEGAQPIKPRIDFVNSLYLRGHHVIIESARGSSNLDYWSELTREQLRRWGVKYHQMRLGVKFDADIYVDDKALNCETFFDGAGDDYLKSESGGKTKVILVDRVYKEASDERMEKLVDEYEFIESLPNTFRDAFPRITFFRNEKEKVYYEMEHYRLPTLRRLMLNESIEVEEILYWCERVTEFSLRMYRHEILPIPNNYVEMMHIQRYVKREEELRKRSVWFDEVLDRESVEINGVNYRNLPQIFEFFATSGFIQIVQPEFVGRWSHSDLHFSNILIDREKDKFILIDPRGYQFCDYYYDFGKFWHSVNGKYEMIATRQFKMENASFELERNKMFFLCEELKEPIKKLLYRFSNEKYEEFELKVEWNEVVHFSSLIPFLLDENGDESRAQCAYYTSVQLANRFLEKYGF